MTAFFPPRHYERLFSAVSAAAFPAGLYQASIRLRTTQNDRLRPRRLMNVDKPPMPSEEIMLDLKAVAEKMIEPDNELEGSPSPGDGANA